MSVSRKEGKCFTFSIVFHVYRDGDIHKGVSMLPKVTLKKGLSPTGHAVQVHNAVL